jgi:hypothetical protein
MVQEEDLVKHVKEIVKSKPAFPVALGDVLIVPGLTKREYYAAKAMQALISLEIINTEKALARASFRYADELCVESDKSLS